MGNGTLVGAGVLVTNTMGALVGTGVLVTNNMGVLVGTLIVGVGVGFTAYFPLQSPSFVYKYDPICSHVCVG